MTIFDGLSLLRLDFEVSWCTRRGRVFLWRLVCDAFRRGGVVVGIQWACTMHGTDA